MSDAPHKFDLHIGDYLRDTEDLSIAQHGAYLRLMLWYYSTAKPIPNDLDRIHRRIGAASREEKASVEFVLSEFFQLSNGKWFHKRIEEELARWGIATKSARESAKLRWEEYRKNKAIEDANAVETQKERNANPYASLLPVTSYHPPVTALPPADPLPSAAKLPVVGAKRATRLAENSLPEPWKEFCLAERPDLNPEEVFAGFKDYWTAIPKGSRLDWFATWRNWIRNQKAVATTDLQPGAAEYLRRHKK